MTSKKTRREHNIIKRQFKETTKNNKENKEEEYVSNSEDNKYLKEIECKKIKIKTDIKEVEEKEIQLLKAIEMCSKLTSKSKTQYNEYNNANTSNLEVIDCVTCGLPINVKNYTKHTEQCFIKKKGYSNNNNNNINSNNNNSKDNQLCGCPTNEFTSGYCERMKKTCPKHINWESLRKSILIQERTRLDQLYNDLIVEENNTMNRIIRRHITNQQQDSKTIQHENT